VVETNRFRVEDTKRAGFGKHRLETLHPTSVLFW